jgi:hypothetical protein
MQLQIGVFGFLRKISGCQVLQSDGGPAAVAAVHAQTADWLTGPRLTDIAMVALPD